MKFFLTALLCLVSMLLFSQKTYNFDYFISCEIKQNTKNEETIAAEYLLDSKSNQQFSFRVFNHEVTGEISDIKDETNHFFDVDAKNSMPVFTYSHSSKFKNRKNSNLNKNNVFEITKIDSLNYKVLVFQNEKKKKIDWLINIALVETSFDWIHFEIHYNRREEIEQKLRSLLNSDKKYIVKKMSFTDPYKYKRTFEIKNI